jgi:8-oxo-dGTP pyrophosphatase MutT (NUDIX family)
VDLRERIQALENGSLQPAAPRDAATVVLVADTAEGVLAYLIRRAAGTTFAGVHAFPGGSVDPVDVTRGVPVHPSLPAAWGPLLDADGPLLAALVGAAVRETFEETGVLLADPGAPGSAPPGEDDRAALEAREVSLAELLRRTGFEVRADALTPIAHWLTPEAEPRRFDTRFFLAALPPGARPERFGTEADDDAWLSPAAALRAAEAGELFMLPPTRSVLTDLAALLERPGVDTAAALVAAARELPVARITPRMTLDADGTTVRIVTGSAAGPDDPSV